MKDITRYILITSLAAAAAACSPDYPELNENVLPQASELDVTIHVDQATNYATFSIANKEMVPVWIFGSELIDGKASKFYAYTGNGLRLRFREAGTHSVEVKAYNMHGLSVGSKTITFEMDETYFDPFDEKPYIDAVSGGSSLDWVWDSTQNSHFGCGPVGDPLGWWQCPAGGKEGFLYDDVMTFSSDGKYTFTPGDGNAYANTGSEYMPDYNTGEDYLFPAETKTTAYHFENNWNDAGIEEIFLCFEPGTIVSYVPHKSAVEEPRFQIMETKTSTMKKKLCFMSTVFTPSNPDGISWYYQFVPEGTGGQEEEDDADFDDALWQGATVTPETWFSAADWSGALTPTLSMTEGNGFTVTIPEGIGGSEWQGQVKLISNIATSEADTYNFRCTFVADEDMTVSCKLTGNPEGEGDTHAFFYNGSVDLDADTPRTFSKKNISQSAGSDHLMIVFDFGRSHAGSTIEVKDICFMKN